jgi:cobyrinic acid a,c-diamide synthase
MPRILISAAHKSSGKTTVSVGLCAALAARGLAVQPFKKGPDYIDPMWLGQAAGRPCFNLDPYLMSWDEIRGLYQRGSQGADISIVEGNKGLYDGLALDGSNSNAALASALELPVVLVLDSRGMTRGIAPLILGYQAFDRGIRIAGVILNNLGGKRHESKLRAVIEHYTDVRVIGAIQNNPDLSVVERHLGLIPSNEAEDAAERVASIGRLVADQVDLDRLLEVARSATKSVSLPPVIVVRPDTEPVRIAIARDRAFGFYYADDLLGLEAAGAVLLPFDALKEPHLPECDALFIGGGFPESFAQQLSANVSLREEIRTALAAGLPAYAECGGLMYLARSLKVGGEVYPMVGAVPGDVLMHPKPVGRGYVHLSQTGASPWAPCDCASRMVRAHEFHYSSIENLPPDLKYGWRVERGYGVDGERDGIVIDNLLASYCHLRMAGGCGWTDRFVAFVRTHRDRLRAAALPA